MHHTRRKSGHGHGHGSANTSMTDVRKAAVTASDPTRYKRPSNTKRSTSYTAQKLGKSPKDREREWNHDQFDDESETFPQFCATCEKQFLPQDDKFLYCSEACRKGDQSSAARSATSRSSSYPNPANYPFYAVSHPEPRDIIPRASPSRPSSMHFSSPPTTPATSGHYQSSAVSALRSLNIRPPSPPSPNGMHPSLWPFSRSAATSPSSSYGRSGAGFFSSTYDNGYGYYSSGTLDRPLPSRHPGGYSRPKSIELVTPMVSR